MLVQIVGITETCERLAIFATEGEAVEFIGKLKNHEDGRYYIDINCELPLILNDKEMTIER